MTAWGANGSGPTLVRRSSEVSLVLEVRLTVGTSWARMDSVAGCRPPAAPRYGIPTSVLRLQTRPGKKCALRALSTLARETVPIVYLDAAAKTDFSLRRCAAVLATLNLIRQALLLNIVRVRSITSN